MSSFSRRTFLTLSAAWPALAKLDFALTPSDDAFLEDLCRRSFQYFWNQSDPRTGLTMDRARASGDARNDRSAGVASLASTGFALTALCIAHERHWIPPQDTLQRVHDTLRFLAYEHPHIRGWFYHFVDSRSGERKWKCELSSIDTALLLAGVITAQQYFREESGIVQMASDIYERVDFQWMLDESTGFLRMGWLPESGFLRSEWVDYRENAILHMLALASPTYAIPPSTWSLFERDPVNLEGYSYVGRGPIFTHQFSHAWIDFRGLRDGPYPGVNYFRNSVTATRAHRAFCLSLRGMFPGYSENIWGITPSDSRIGYLAWGGLPRSRDLDGTVVPCAAGGSLMLAPDICLPALRAMHEDFGELIYGPYGFVDAFHPLMTWVNPDVIGIDVGITLLSAENLRTGNVWNWFMRSRDIRRAMERTFQPED